MKRLTIYYVGIVLIILLINWLTHFAVEPKINFKNVYTQKALIETIVLLCSIIFLLAFLKYKNVVIKAFFLLSQLGAIFLFVFLVLDLLNGGATAFSIPYYIAYIYCLFFSMLVLYKGIIRQQPVN